MMLSARGYLLLLVACLVSSGSSFVIPRQRLFSVTTVTTTTTTTTCLEAKKKKKRPTTGQGFGKEPPPPPAPKASAPAETAVEESSGSTPLQSIESGGSDAIPTYIRPEPELDPNLPPEERTKTLLREKYGLRTREEQELENKKEEKRREAIKRKQELEKMAELDQDIDIMAILPAPILVAIDAFLKIGTGVTTVAFVAAGLAITAEAWAHASGNPLPQDVDDFIVNVVEPNFTLGLLVLLSFSVSLGVFAAAQLGSDSSQYKEDN